MTEPERASSPVFGHALVTTSRYGGVIGGSSSWPGANVKRAGGRYAADLLLATAGSRVRFRCDCTTLRSSAS
jgi:hypothetical protein